jgi:hypothetical protein
MAPGSRQVVEFPAHAVGELRYHTFGVLDAEGVLHAVFTRRGGASAAPYEGLNCAWRTEDPRAAENRAAALAALQLHSGHCVYASGRHGADIRTVREPLSSLEGLTVLQGVDGLLTDNPEVVLALAVADCIPVLLVGPRQRAVGLIHAGWRGVDLEILPRAIEGMQREFGVLPEELVACFGPAICPRHYRVESPAQARDPRWRSYLRRVENELYEVGIVGFAREQLRRAGVPAERIHDCGLCTWEHNSEFFSCRREGYRSGRFLVLLSPGSPAPRKG